MISNLIAAIFERGEGSALLNATAAKGNPERWESADNRSAHDTALMRIVRSRDLESLVCFLASLPGFRQPGMQVPDEEVPQQVREVLDERHRLTGQNALSIALAQGWRYVEVISTLPHALIKASPPVGQLQPPWS